MEESSNILKIYTGYHELLSSGESFTPEVVSVMRNEVLSLMGSPNLNEDQKDTLRIVLQYL